MEVTDKLRKETEDKISELTYRYFMRLFIPREDMKFPEEGTPEEFKEAVLEEVYTKVCMTCGMFDVANAEDELTFGCLRWCGGSSIQVRNRAT